MNVLSLCDGHSCGYQVLKELGIQVDSYYASEVKPYAAKIAKKNHPDIIELGDIYNITEEFIINLKEKIHLVLSGTPCQSHSRNGKHGGFTDPRGEIFFQFVKILEWIRKHNNPDVLFLFENVQMKKKSVDLISESLGVEVLKIDLKYFCAQRRLRYYWTNVLVETIDKTREDNYLLKDILLDCKDEEDIVKYKWYFPTELNKRFNSRVVEIKSDKKIDGIPVWTTVSDNFMEKVDGEVRARNATQIGYLVVNNYDSISTSFPNSNTRRGRVGNQKAATLDVGCSQMVFIDGMFRDFDLIELERLQGLPDDYTSGVSDTNRKDLIGEGWQIDTVKFILGSLVDLVEVD